jgi:DMSO/TMAO reductase YedYZ molybdopterin-dependent catalytic subunit
MPERSSSTIHRKIAAFIPILVVAMLAQILPSAPKTSAQSTAVPAELRISGSVATPLVLTVADLKKMPRKTLSVVNPHDKTKKTYAGVALEELLHRAGAPQGEQLRGRAMATYVIAEAEDGYRVVFSLAELDSGILESEVIVAEILWTARR